MIKEHKSLIENKQQKLYMSKDCVSVSCVSDNFHTSAIIIFLELKELSFDKVSFEKIAAGRRLNT
jgi:hypothetical protein